MNTKKTYSPPTLTAVSFKVELGNLMSGSNPQASSLDLFTISGQDYNSQAQENWTEQGNLFGGSTGW